MPSVQARRTLVKSPPELWAELSDAEALNRRLEPFGEIRITRLEPESTVAWEGERARGTVEIEPSGWGTRVTLTAEASEPEPVAEDSGARATGEAGLADAVEAEAETPEEEPEAVEASRSEPPPAVEPDPEAVEASQSEPPPAVEPDPEARVLPPPPDPAAQASSPPSEPGVREELPQTIAALGQDISFDLSARPARERPEPRRLWDRLFRRGRGREVPAPPVAVAPLDPAAETARPEPAPEPRPEPQPGPGAEPAPPVDPQPTVPLAPPQPEPELDPEPEPPLQPAAAAPSPPAVTEPAGDLAPGVAEELDQVLAGVLDALGSAHHRPFSRG